MGKKISKSQRYLRLPKLPFQGNEIWRGVRTWSELLALLDEWKRSLSLAVRRSDWETGIRKDDGGGFRGRWMRTHMAWSHEYKQNPQNSIVTMWHSCWCYVEMTPQVTHEAGRREFTRVQLTLADHKPVQDGQKKVKVTKEIQYVLLREKILD